MPNNADTRVQKCVEVGKMTTLTPSLENKLIVGLTIRKELLAVSIPVERYNKFLELEDAAVAYERTQERSAVSGTIADVLLTFDPTKG